jgi:hypothetical protein
MDVLNRSAGAACSPLTFSVAVQKVYANITGVPVSPGFMLKISRYTRNDMIARIATSGYILLAMTNY